MKNRLLIFILCISFQSLALAKTVYLDVRTPEEYAVEHIPGSLNMDVKNPQFRQNIDKLSRKDDYKVYCGTGRRSAQAVEAMKGLGFKHLQNLGGLEDAKKFLKR